MRNQNRLVLACALIQNKENQHEHTKNFGTRRYPCFIRSHVDYSAGSVWFFLYYLFVTLVLLRLFFCFSFSLCLCCWKIANCFLPTVLLLRCFAETGNLSSLQLYLLKFAKVLDFTINYLHYSITIIEKVGLVRRNNNSWTFSNQVTNNCIIPQSFTNVCINSWKRIIKEVDIGIGVDSSRQTDSCLLTTWESNTFTSNFSHITCWKHLEIIC